MALLDEFEPFIKQALSYGEGIADIRVAAQIISGERARVRGRESATRQDAEIALLSLCIPIPGGPPKKPDYKEDAEKFRRDVLPGIAKNKKQQEELTRSLRKELLSIERATFYYPSFERFFRFKTGEQSPEL